MRHALLVAALFCAACASDRSSASAAKAGNAAATAPVKGPAMKGTYAAAAEAFSAYAAGKLGLAEDKLLGVGPHEAIAKMNKARVGHVWAFGARPAADASAAEVRGWATEDGVVITLEQNLGLLFAEAGVWGGGAAPALTAPELAERLAWAMGANVSVFVLVAQGLAAPELKLEDGAGKLTFHVNVSPPGAGRGPRQVSRVEVEVSKDQRATLTRTAIPAP